LVISTSINYSLWRWLFRS